MATLTEYLNKVRQIDVGLASQLAIDNTADTMAEEQRKQLAQGIRSDNTEMPEYSFRSVFQHGKPPGPILLYETGSFYRGITISVQADIYTVSSTDSKTSMLENRYGREILGLGTAAKIGYIRVLRPEFIKQIKSWLN
jgi:hypothetical protein